MIKEVIQDERNVLSKWRSPNLFQLGVIILFFGLFLLCFGIYIYYIARTVFQIKMRYDEQCSKHCALQFTLSERIKAPIYIYYEIQKFYQNHQIYLESFSQEQLSGNKYFETDNCWPVITNSQMNKYISLDYQILNQSDVAIPCGLIAKTFFNDRYSLHFKNGSDFSKIEINHEKISWSVDKEKYKNINLTLQWVDMENEHFQVWMRIAPTNKFKKLWGIIHQDLEIGVYRVIIHNNYDIAQVGGKKLFVLSTLSSLGGQQTVLVLGYIFTGIIFILIGMFVIFLHYRDRKFIRDYRDFKMKQ